MAPRPEWSSVKTTSALAVGVALLVIGVWVATLLTPSPQPMTVDAAVAEVAARLDRIEGTLPEGSVLDRSETVKVEACPLQGRGEQARMLRVFDVDPEFDRVTWARTLADEFAESDGWAVRTKALETRENLEIRVVGRDLLVVDIIARGDTAQARITLRSLSECSAS
ncbi:hypothetical protein GCM10017608_34320 [Agromyces luteolus]|uniref:DUF3515 family protein n=1 Tax=Agromyces luteolus TaxID=88373 RepID=A0A7C9HMW6_9MICO|nr:hypothetical protein [Agromyces luteolus]MUN08222.1 hypothetical protein [Agromyces luteolus]GLK29494.1 hypothetical protein GCM10017608_34320 [Agromyces luteolus]